MSATITVKLRRMRGAEGPGWYADADGSVGGFRAHNGFIGLVFHEDMHDKPPTLGLRPGVSRYSFRRFQAFLAAVKTGGHVADWTPEAQRAFERYVAKWGTS